jgi:hypothetical protein
MTRNLGDASCKERFINKEKSSKPDLHPHWWRSPHSISCPASECMQGYQRIPRLLSPILRLTHLNSNPLPPPSRVFLLATHLRVLCHRVNPPRSHLFPPSSPLTSSSTNCGTGSRNSSAHFYRTWKRKPSLIHWSILEPEGYNSKEVSFRVLK